MTSPANDIPNSEIWSSAPTVVEILGEEKYLELEAENNLKMFLPIWMPIFEAALTENAPYFTRWSIDILSGDSTSFADRDAHLNYLIEKYQDWQAEQRLQRIEAALGLKTILPTPPVTVIAPPIPNHNGSTWDDFFDWYYSGGIVQYPRIMNLGNAIPFSVRTIHNNHSLYTKQYGKLPRRVIE